MRDETAVMDDLSRYGADMEGILERFMDDTELYISCFQQFMEDTHFDMLERALAEGDYQAAFTAAHTLKGVAGNMGLSPLYQKICELVEALRGNRLDNVAEMCGDILAERAQLVSLIQ